MHTRPYWYSFGRNCCEERLRHLPAGLGAAGGWEMGGLRSFSDSGLLKLWSMLLSCRRFCWCGEAPFVGLGFSIWFSTILRLHISIRGDTA